VLAAFAKVMPDLEVVWRQSTDRLRQVNHGSYLRLRLFYHSTLGWRVIQKKKKVNPPYP